MRAVAIDRAELLEHLAEQRALLEDGARRYDEGFLPAFKQMAVTLRVLLHDTSSSKSVLGQLGVKHRVRWLASGEVNPQNLISSSTLTGMRVKNGEGFLEVAYTPHDEATCLEFGKLQEFDPWWTAPVIRIIGRGGNQDYARSNMVRYVANKAGGAHVDSIPVALRDLEKGNALGWAAHVDGEDHELTISPVPATIRTVATEVLLTLHNNEDVLLSS